MILKTFWKPVCWAVIIIVLSIIPTNDLNNHILSVVPNEDKIMHFIFYGIFSFLLIRALLIHFKKSRPVRLLAMIAFLIIFIFGITLELIQAKFTTYRQGDIMDMVFNQAGCIFSILLVALFPKLRFSS